MVRYKARHEGSVTTTEGCVVRRITHAFTAPSSCFDQPNVNHQPCWPYVNLPSVTYCLLLLVDNAETIYNSIRLHSSLIGLTLHNLAGRDFADHPTVALNS